MAWNREEQIGKMEHGEVEMDTPNVEEVHSQFIGKRLEI